MSDSKAGTGRLARAQAALAQAQAAEAAAQAEHDARMQFALGNGNKQGAAAWKSAERRLLAARRRRERAQERLAKLAEG